MSRPRLIPDVLLEQLALGELPPEFDKKIRHRLEQEPGGMERLDHLRASNEEILSTCPPRQVVAEIKRRYADAPSPRRTGAGYWLAAPALATATAVVLVIWAFLPAVPISKRSEVPEEVIRVKGDSRLIVFRKQNNDVAQLSPGAVVRAGDVLQLEYLAAGASNGVIFSIDGRGTVTLHFPETRGHPTILEGGGAHALPYAYEIDDAPQFERFFFITGGGSIHIDQVLEAGSRLGANLKRPLELPDNLIQTEFVLKKQNGDESEDE